MAPARREAAAAITTAPATARVAPSSDVDASVGGIGASRTKPVYTPQIALLDSRPPLEWAQQGTCIAPSGVWLSVRHV